MKKIMHVNQPIMRHNLKKYAATDRVQQKRSSMYATLILVAIALSALSCVISSPSNCIAWIVMVVFAWLAWPGKQKRGIMAYNSKETLPCSSLPAAKPPEEAARAVRDPAKGLVILTVPALVAVTVLEPTNYFPVARVPEAVIGAVMSPTSTSRIVAEQSA